VIGSASGRRRREHIAKHRLGEQPPLAGRISARQPGLGKFKLLSCYQDKAHGVSL